MQHEGIAKDITKQFAPILIKQKASCSNRLIRSMEPQPPACRENSCRWIECFLIMCSFVAKAFKTFRHSS